MRNDTFWWDLKDKVKLRCCAKCEFCWLRRGEQLHHRHYGTYGRERLEDVMLVCDPCRRAISGKWPWGKPITCVPGCLLDQGDLGDKVTDRNHGLWEKYLKELPLKWRSADERAEASTQSSSP